MLILTKEQIAARIDPSSLGDAITAAYIAASAGEIELPPVGHITFPDANADCHIKYGHRRGDDVFVIKIATGFPQNATASAASAAPVNNGVSLVISATSGEVRAVLHDEMLLTDIRTGVAGAIATRALARPDATRLLVVGTGVQARHQIQAHRDLLDQQLAVTVWGRSAAKARALADEIEDVTIADDLDAACAAVDIIVTTTGARTPIIMNQAVQPGTHITAVGADAPGKHELDPALLKRADSLVADSRSQCFDHGELSVLEPTASVVELGEVLAGQVPGRGTKNDITIADLTGIAAQDIAIAGALLATSEPRISEAG